jgi:hypothetical protein
MKITPLRTVYFSKHRKRYYSAHPQNALFSSIKDAKVNASNDKQVREKPDTGPQRTH